MPPQGSCWCQLLPTDSSAKKKIWGSSQDHPKIIQRFMVLSRNVGTMIYASQSVVCLAISRQAQIIYRCFLHTRYTYLLSTYIHTHTYLYMLKHAALRCEHEDSSKEDHLGWSWRNFSCQHRIMQSEGTCAATLKNGWHELLLLMAGKGCSCWEFICIWKSSGKWHILHGTCHVVNQMLQTIQGTSHFPVLLITPSYKTGTPNLS